MKNIYLLATLFLVGILFSVDSAKAQVVINEYSVTNIDTYPDNYGEYPDWLELYNTASVSVNLAGYYLSDNPNNPTKWQFGLNATIPAHGFKKIWLSGRNESTFAGIHTNFKITQTKTPAESLLFSDPSGTVLEQHLIEINQRGHSRGRTTDGASTWSVFTSPTCGTSNNLSEGYPGYAQAPVMDKAAGFYPGSIMVSISTPEPDAVIRYTLNGTEPTVTSTAYTGPLSVSSTRAIRARSFSNNPQILPSLDEFNTYFVNVSYSLPVVSVTGDQLIDLLNGDASLVPYGSYEYFNRDKERTTKSFGQINKHGQDSWANPQRSIDLVCRDECGYSNALNGQFFPTSTRTEFQRLILRAAGDDNYPALDTSAHMRDDFIMTASELMGQNLDWRRSHRCIVYANGQFWGVYSLRERDDDADYMNYYYGQDRYHLQMNLLWGGTWAEYGGQQSLDDYHDLYYYIMHNNMANEANFNYVASQYDYTSLADYMIINSYAVCSDWINWNVGWWRGLDSTGTKKRWCYILWDEDAIFNHYINYTGIPTQLPTASPCFQEGITSDPEGHVDILNRLKANPVFKQYYVNRYVDLMNTGFKPEWMIHLLDSMAAMIEPEMTRHCTRWGGSLQEWKNNVQKIRNFINTRYDAIKTGLNGCYDLTGPYNITVNVDPPLKGKVKVNSIIPETYPWNAFYYGGIDVKLSEIEVDPNYKFDHWELLHHVVQPSDTSKEVTLRLTMGDQIKAVFIPREKNDTLVINEINYNSSSDFDPGDWVELYNPQPYPVDVTNWVFKDEVDIHAYSIPQGTVMPAFGYLVLCADTAKFDALFPSIHNRLGNLGFNFSGNGELLRLYNPDVLLIDTVHYDDTAPWPTDPDGNGATLELINPILDNALWSSWKASFNAHGTPGEPNFYVGTPELSYEKNRLVFAISPNPMHSYADVSIQQTQLSEPRTLVIYDIMGKEVKRYEDISSTEFRFYREGLENGVYMVKLTGGRNQVEFCCKMVVN
ncbi:MAG: CotH kinase family protein [Bacteroidetes bacterium]|nr:CotH kinase family protein [Bacteroidota bacterium]